MLSKSLVITALVFQVIGLVWDFVYHIQTDTINIFFEQAHWPIFIGFILLLVAVLQALPKKKITDQSPNKDNQFLP